MHAKSLLFCSATIASIVTFTGGSHAQETIAGFEIIAAPNSVTLNATGGFFDVLTVVDGPPAGPAVSFAEALTGFSIIDDGVANLTAESTLLFGFAQPIVNGPGDDLVLFEAGFNVGGYTVSTTSSTDELTIAPTDFIDTGINRSYFLSSANQPAEPLLSDVFAIGVDLSDLGIAPGGTTPGIIVNPTDSEADPLGLGLLAVPEPASLALACLATLAFNGRRRF